MSKRLYRRLAELIIRRDQENLIDFYTKFADGTSKADTPLHIYLHRDDSLSLGEAEQDAHVPVVWAPEDGYPIADGSGKMRCYLLWETVLLDRIAVLLEQSDM